MNVYLIRHAEALSLGTAGIATDDDRPLTDDGKGQAELLADLFARLGIPIQQIVTSPLLRARQTADVLRARLQIPAESVTICDHLAMGGSSKKLAKSLKQMGAESIAVVGHEPDMGRHTAWLIGSKKAQIEFAKAGTACVVCDSSLGKGSGSLSWLVTPKLLK